MPKSIQVSVNSQSSIKASVNASGTAINISPLTAIPYVITYGPKAITIMSPVVPDQVIIFFSPIAITISKVISVVLGTSPSVTYTLKYGRDVGGGGTIIAAITETNTNTGSDITTFNSSNIPANSFLWIEISAISGSVTSFSVTLEF